MAARKILTLLGAVALAATAFATPAAAGVELVADPASYVDPLIGSTNAGNTYPGATTPFGMIAWSPTTTKGLQNGTGAAGGYQYDVTRVRGFSLTHLNGTGCTPGASGDVPIMPFPGAVLSSPSADRTDQVFASDFSHADETAEPGHYGVGLANGVGVDLTTTDRAGLGRFTFPADKPANLLFRTSNSLPGSSNASISIDAAHRRVTGSVDSGGFCGRTTGGEENQRSYYTLHFSVTFDQPITGQGTWVDGTLRPGTSSATGGEGFTDAARVGKGSGGYVGFDASKGPVTARIGISYVSAANAQRNADAEIPMRPDVRRRPRVGPEGLAGPADEDRARRRHARAAHDVLHRALPRAAAAEPGQRRHRRVPRQRPEGPPAREGPARAVRHVLRLGRLPRAGPAARVPRPGPGGRLRAVALQLRRAERR